MPTKKVQDDVFGQSFDVAKPGTCAEMLTETRCAPVDSCGDAGGDGLEGKGESGVTRDRVSQTQGCIRQGSVEASTLWIKLAKRM